MPDVVFCFMKIPDTLQNMNVKEPLEVYMVKKESVALLIHLEVPLDRLHRVIIAKHLFHIKHDLKEKKRSIPF